MWRILRGLLKLALVVATVAFVVQLMVEPVVERPGRDRPAARAPAPASAETVFVIDERRPLLGSEAR